LSSRGWARGKTKGEYRGLELMKYKIKRGKNYAILYFTGKRFWFIFMKSLCGKIKSADIYYLSHSVIHLLQFKLEQDVRPDEGSISYKPWPACPCVPSTSFIANYFE